ncbi:MAG: hypothetical protein RMJ66_00035 [Bacteroidia bacterium]|nr:hypothetical protein [Bacteroidia bacterium]MDW8133433.1 hypothetical protein [Bacteroidia bacterium]
MERLSLSQLWQTAWERFKVNWIPGVIIFLAGIVIGLIPFIGNIASLILPPVMVSYGLLTWTTKEEVKFSAIFPSQIMTYLKVIVGLILISLVPLLLIFAAMYTGLREGEIANTPYPIILGVALMIVLQALFFSYPYWIIDKDLDIIGGLKAALQTSLSNISSLILFMLSLLLVNLIGMIACGLGLLVTFPLSFIAMAGFYKELSSGTS